MVVVSKSQQVRACLANFRQKSRNRHINAQIIYLKSVRRKHRSHQGLADFVDIAVHGADNHFPCKFTFLLAGAQLRLQQLHRILHTVRRDDQVRQKELTAGKLFTDDIHTRNQPLIDDRHWLYTSRKSLPGKFNNLFCFSFNDGCGELGNDVLIHIAFL
jgi:hypothetical protein